MYLRHKDVHTLPQLLAALRSSYEMPGVGRLQAEELRESADAQLWLRPHVDPTLLGVKKGQQFTIVLKEHPLLGKSLPLVTAKAYAASEHEIEVGFLLQVTLGDFAPRCHYQPNCTAPTVAARHC